MKIFVSIIAITAAFAGWLAWAEQDELVVQKKINGVSLVSPHFVIDSVEMNTLNAINTNAVAIIPFAFSNQSDPGVYFNHERQWWGERTDGTAVLIRLAHEAGFEVMVKPQIWMRGDWIGDFWLTNEEDWELWEQNYEAYILTYARQAEELDVELFCIGTELKLVVKYRPEFWHDLIIKVREVYQGKITYAANWDSYTNVAFWEALDYIGIDAYFPLVDKAHCATDEIVSAWLPLKKELKQFSEAYDKQILFTEYGYQSVNGAAGNHWEVIMTPDQKNDQLQANAYEALYRSLWAEPWFSGGYLWKWHFGKNRGRNGALSFTPQDKSAEEVIARWYKTD